MCMIGSRTALSIKTRIAVDECHTAFCTFFLFDTFARTRVREKEKGGGRWSCRCRRKTFMRGARNCRTRSATRRSEKWHRGRARTPRGSLFITAFQRLNPATARVLAIVRVPAFLRSHPYLIASPHPSCSIFIRDERGSGLSRCSRRPWQVKCVTNKQFISHVARSLPQISPILSLFRVFPLSLSLSFSRSFSAYLFPAR